MRLPGSNTEERWVSAFAVDIHSHLRKREKERYRFSGRSPQLALRPKMVELLHRICSDRDYCKTAKHLAVYLLDMFMKRNYIKEEHWQLFVVGCLSIAVKLEENSDLIPSNRELCKLLDSNYLPLDIKYVEVTTLTFFNWNVLFPTAAHFAEYYELYAIARKVDDLHGGKCNYELIQTAIHHCVEYFLNIVLEDTKYYKYRPSLIAASCIAAARIHLMLFPPWHPALRHATRYKFKDLESCIEMLLSELQVDLLQRKH